MSIVPPWVYWVAIAGLGVALAGQEVRVQVAKSATEKVRREWAEDRSARQESARKMIEFNAKLQSDHAAAQQESEHAFNQQKLALERRLRDSTSTAGRLRDQLATFTARGGAWDQTDPVTCERAQHRLESVGGLLASSVELLVEGRGIVEKRDAEVRRLVDQITADRSAIDTSAPPPLR